MNEYKNIEWMIEINQLRYKLINIVLVEIELCEQNHHCKIVHT